MSRFFHLARSAVRCCAPGLFVWMLVGCGGDLLNRQRPYPGKAVENPWNTSTADDEIFSRDSGAWPFFSWDFGSKKNEPPVFHSVFDTFAESPPPPPQPRPASRPTSAPYGISTSQAAIAAVPAVIQSTQVRAVSQQAPADQFSITDSSKGVDVVVTCPSGLGTVTLERNADNWPALIRVSFQYAADKQFTHLESFKASELTSSPDPAQGAQGPKIALKATIDKGACTAEIAIPAFARNRQILIEWADTFR